MSAAELLALLAFCHGDELLAGAQHHLVHRPGGQPWAAARPALLPGRARGLDDAMVACGLGLGALVTGVPALRWAVKVAGAAYMLWLAWKLAGSGQLTQVDAGRLDVDILAGRGPAVPEHQGMDAGAHAHRRLGRQRGRPPAANPGERLAIISAIMVVFAFSSNFAYAWLGSMLRQWLSQGSRLLWFNRALALVLVATAAWMLTV